MRDLLDKQNSKSLVMKRVVILILFLVVVFFTLRKASNFLITNMGSYCSQLTTVCSTPPNKVYSWTNGDTVLVINFITTTQFTLCAYIYSDGTFIDKFSTTYNFTLDQNCNISFTYASGLVDGLFQSASTILKSLVVDQLSLNHYGMNQNVTFTQRTELPSANYTGNYTYTPPSMYTAPTGGNAQVIVYLNDSYYGNITIQNIIIHYDTDVPTGLEIICTSGQKFVASSILLGVDYWYSASIQSFNSRYVVKFRYVDSKIYESVFDISPSSKIQINWVFRNLGVFPSNIDFPGVKTTTQIDTTSNLPGNCIPTGYYTATNSQGYNLSITITDPTHLTYVFMSVDGATQKPGLYTGYYTFTINRCMGIPLFVSGTHGYAIEAGFTVGTGGTTLSINSYYNDGSSLVFNQTTPVVSSSYTGTFTSLGSSLANGNPIVISQSGVFIPGIGSGPLTPVISDVSSSMVTISGRNYKIQTGPVMKISETVNGLTNTYNVTPVAVPTIAQVQSAPSLVNTFRLRYGDYATGVDENGNPLYLTGSINLYTDGSIVGGGSKYTVDSTGAVKTGINSDNSDYISSLMNQWSTYTGNGTVTLYYLSDQATSRNTNPKSSTTLINAIDSTGAVTMYFATFY